MSMMIENAIIICTVFDIFAHSYRVAKQLEIFAISFLSMF